MRAGNYQIFGKANLEGDSLDLFHHTWTHVLDGLPSELNVNFLYMRTPVEAANIRIAQRGRDAEQTIPREYMQKLHDNHETWTQSPDMKGKHHVINTWMGITETRNLAIEQICQWVDQAGAAYITQRNSVKDSQFTANKLTTMAHNAKVICARLRKQDKKAETDCGSVEVS